MLSFAIKMAILILKRALVVLKRKAAESPSVLDDIAVEALEDVITLYESGGLARITG